MQFHVSMDDEEYIRFNEFHVCNSRLGKRSLRLYFWRIPIIGVLFTLLLFAVGSETFYVAVAGGTFLVASVVWAFLYRKIFLGSVRKTVLRMKESGKLPYHAEAELTLEDGVLTEDSPEGSHRIKLTKEIRTYETPDAVYIYFSVQEAILVSMEDMGADREEFLDQLKALTDYHTVKKVWIY